MMTVLKVLAGVLFFLWCLVVIWMGVHNPARVRYARWYGLSHRRDE